METIYKKKCIHLCKPMKQRDGAGRAKAIDWSMSTLCGGINFKATAPIFKTQICRKKIFGM
jgi:hypothetical protein